MRHKMKINELGALHKLDAIEEWQKDKNVHPLTCGNDANHTLLVGEFIKKDGIISMGITGGIQLKCPDCDYVQSHIPKPVFSAYIDKHMQHKIPLGQVVEFDRDDGWGVDAIYYGNDYKFPADRSWMKPTEGVEGDQEIVLTVIGTYRGIVVGRSRDCDGTPLYAVSDARIEYLRDKSTEPSIVETMNYKKWCNWLITGISQDGLRVIEGQFVPLLYKSAFEYENHYAGKTKKSE
jgi:hypothetical protein